MNRRVSIAVVLVAGLILTGLLRAQEAKPVVTLKPGDPAPALLGTKWIKGEPVKSFENGKIYVVEFWATWCGPCREAIPHVSQMQAKYKDQGVTFIGQDVWEHDQSAAEPFVRQMGDKMDYRVVMDDVSGGDEQKGKMAVAWMQAAGKNGIPCSFLIDRQGKIAWIGHPMELEIVLKQVVAGTFDVQKEAARQAAVDALELKLENAMRDKNYDQALGVLDEYQTLDPAKEGPISAMRFSVLLQKKDYDGAYKMAAAVGDAKDVEADLLNEIAWTIVDAPGLAKRDLDVAEKLANRARQMTDDKNANILDTCARVQFEKGNIEKAIDLQTKAVGNADPEMKTQLQQTLDRYKSAKKPV